jgi:hypothetical protein
MELQAAVDYHDYYVASIDKALGQPRENGDIRSAHMIQIGKMRAVYAAMADSQTKTCGNCRLTGMAVCVACAERCANDGGFAHLFWMVNHPQRCIVTGVCPECGKRMNGGEAKAAAGRVAKLLKRKEGNK